MTIGSIELLQQAEQLEKEGAFPSAKVLRGMYTGEYVRYKEIGTVPIFFAALMLGTAVKVLGSGDEVIEVCGPDSTDYSIGIKHSRQIILDMLLSGTPVSKVFNERLAAWDVARLLERHPPVTKADAEKMVADIHAAIANGGDAKPMITIESMVMLEEPAPTGRGYLSCLIHVDDAGFIERDHRDPVEIEKLLDAEEEHDDV